MQADVTHEAKLCIDGKTFYEGSDICFIRGGIQYIAQIVQIVPEIGNHPVSIICDNVTVIKGVETFKVSDVEEISLVFYIENLEKVDYVYVD